MKKYSKTQMDALEKLKEKYRILLRKDFEKALLDGNGKEYMEDLQQYIDTEEMTKPIKYEGKK